MFTSDATVRLAVLAVLHHLSEREIREAVVRAQATTLLRQWVGRWSIEDAVNAVVAARGGVDVRWEGETHRAEAPR